MAAAYEERCARERAAATIAGLLRYFDEAAQVVLVRDEERASDEQHVGTGDGAVTVLTYHRAKGLEWPVVILGSLDKSERRNAFEVSPETDHPDFDPGDPLAGRWIRYWPWPFGLQKKTPLTDVAAASVEGRAVALREERERVRLLYVGFTRARDHLILAARVEAKGPAVEWLDELCDADDKPLVKLPSEPGASGRSVVSLRGIGGRVLRSPRATGCSVRVATRPRASRIRTRTCGSPGPTRPLFRNLHDRRTGSPPREPQRNGLISWCLPRSRLPCRQRPRPSSSSR